MRKPSTGICLNSDKVLERGCKVSPIHGPVTEAAVAGDSGTTDEGPSRGLVEALAGLFARLEGKVDALLAVVEKQRRIKDWYTTAEVAEEIQKSDFTVREYCRLGQCKAQKSKGYRGGKKQWMISHEEKLRLENEGPAPMGTYRSPSPKN
jgi:hypothetical protein